MSVASWIADETAAHYDALRDRRIPWPLAWLMTTRFHRDLSYSIIQDDQFCVVVERVLAPQYTTGDETGG